MKLSFKGLDQINQLAAPLKDKFAKESISYGLDIGTCCTKMVKLRFFKESFELLDVRVEPTTLDQVSSLKKCLAGQTIKKANISLCGPSTIIRYTQFPRMKESELKTAMKFEAEKLIPFSVNEVVIDAAILRNDLPENKMLVLLAAAKKEAVNQRIKLLEGAGLRPGLLDLDSLAVANAFNRGFVQESAKGKSAALLNIGAAFSNLSIIEEGMPRFSRDFQIAGNSFTQKVAESLGVDAKTAEAAKIKPDDANREKIRDAVDAVLSNLASEVRLSFDYYESQCACSVNKIFLSGAGSLSAGLKETLSELIGLNIEYWDPFKNIAGSDILKSGTGIPLNSHLAVATGLALRI